MQQSKVFYRRPPSLSCMTPKISMTTISFIGHSDSRSISRLFLNLRRFSFAPQRYGPRGHQALAGAIRYASSFNYTVIDNTVLHDVPSCSCRILSGLSGPPNTVSTLLSRAGSALELPLFHHTDLLQSWLFGAQNPPALAKYFTGELTKSRLVTLIRSGTVESITHGVSSPSICSKSRLFCLYGLPATHPAPRSYHGTLSHSFSRPACAFSTAPVGSTPRPTGPRSEAPTSYQGRGEGSKGPEKAKAKPARTRVKTRTLVKGKTRDLKKARAKEKVKGKGKAKAKAPIGIPILTFHPTIRLKMRGLLLDL